MERLKVYFAHPISTYGTVKEASIIKEIQYLDFEVVNPADYSKEARELTTRAGGGWLSCEVCREEVMEPLFYRLLRECHYVVYRNPLNICGVRCEVDLARKLGRLVFELSELVSVFQLKDIAVAETYQLPEVLTKLEGDSHITRVLRKLQGLRKR